MAPTSKRRELPRPKSYDNNFAFFKSLTEKKKKKTECSMMKQNDLQMKIDYEMKMQEGTKKLLAACKHPVQSLEAAKSFMTSTKRMDTYQKELQRRESTGKEQVNVLCELAEPILARVAVSDIRMPLIWKDSDHFKNKGDYRRFTVFCLLKIGTQIFDTALVHNIDRSMTDITFNDVNIFEQVPHNFEFHMEIYSHVFNEDLSIASTPRKIKNRISSSLSRTLGRKLAAALKHDLNTYEENQSRFDLIGYASLKLEDANNAIGTHDMKVVTLSDPHSQLPLYGHFCCRLAVQVDCTVNEKYSGHLSLIQQVGEVSGRRRLWCRLRNFQLCFWSKQEDADSQNAVLTVTINKSTKVESPVVNHQYSFCIANGKIEHNLIADSENSLKIWLTNLRQHIDDHEYWGEVATTQMSIPTSPGFVASPMPYHVQGLSLYDETSITEIGGKPSSFVLQDCGNKHSPTSLRSRSCSTSSASSSVAPTRKPFSFMKFRRSTKN